jgi:hypothetical protein
MTSSRKRSYTQAELSELADGLGRLLDTIDQGEMTAGPGTVSRLEGAMIALRSLAAGPPLAANELLPSPDAKGNDRTTRLPRNRAG